MAHEQSLRTMPPQQYPICTCEQAECKATGCALLEEMRRSLDSLQKRNQELQSSLAELEHLASTDRLTGAWNRRRLEESVNSEMDRMKRHGHPLSLLVLDIDLFKRVNDHYGHAAGDRLLVELSGIIRAELRTTDSLTRWGGEEFVILCPDTALSTAAVFAERLRTAIGRTNFSAGENITVSIGAAECLPEESWEQWFHRADTMLLRAKASGKNRVQTAPEIPAWEGTSETGLSNLLRLVWRPAYECGHEVLDREHKMLFGGVNDVLAAILSGRPAQETGALVETLIRDVEQHFRDEESAIEAAAYPGSAEHAAIHRALVARAIDLLQRFRVGQADAGEVFRFLAYDFIVRHILRADRSFFPYLQSHCEAAARRPASTSAA